MLKMKSQVKRNPKGYYPIVHEGVEYLLASVTTVLKRVFNKPGIYGWYGKYGNDKCRKILTESGHIGTAVHKFIHWDLFEQTKGIKTVPSLEMKQAVDNYFAFKKEYKLKPILGEQTVYSLEYGFAGQLDLIGVVTDEKKKKVVLLDWKTSSGIYEDHELQLQAYYKAAMELKMLKPEELWCVRLDKNSPINYNTDIAKYKPNKKSLRAFLGLLEVFNWLKERSK